MLRFLVGPGLCDATIGPGLFLPAWLGASCRGRHLRHGALEDLGRSSRPAPECLPFE